MLESGNIKDNYPEYPHDALHVYPRNPHVDVQKKLKLQELAPEEQHVVIKAIDNTKDKHTQLLNFNHQTMKLTQGDTGH